MDPVMVAMEEATCRLNETNEAIRKGGSEIQRFYEGSVVLVTGANGFMGKVLVEKLLRACNVKKIYVLLREKKGKSVTERLDEMMNDPVFEYVRETQPSFSDKISPLRGDVSAIRLGISDVDWNIVIGEIDTMFHLAATTRMDEALATATLINVRGTREMLMLAKHCPKLRVFVHVSTAYCHATTYNHGVELKEQFYKSPISPEALIQLADTLDADRLEAITPELIKGWPNTYAFTKAVAEELVRSISEHLPICIVRPPIVLCTHYEPTPGWLDKNSIYSPTAIMIGTWLGITRVWWVRKNVKVCVMPGDYVNNTILAAGWDRASSQNNIKIYTISSTKANVRFSLITSTLISDVMRTYSSPKAVWYWYLFEVDNPFVYRVLLWILHYIPAYILDSICYVFKISKPTGISSFVKLYEKLERMGSVYQYYLNNDWCFDDSNVVLLHQKMSPLDRTVFNIDASTINWENMFYNWAMGVKQFILKEKPKDNVYAIKKQKILKVANYACLCLYIIVFYYILYLLYSFFKLSYV